MKASLLLSCHGHMTKGFTRIGQHCGKHGKIRLLVSANYKMVSCRTMLGRGEGEEIDTHWHGIQSAAQRN